VLSSIYRYINRRKDTPQSYTDKLEHDLLPEPYYGYCILSAAQQAKVLGYERISIIEFGVAGGNGLLSIEWNCQQISNIVGIDFEVCGFDSGIGLPKPSDPKDLPYLWFEGDFLMDIALLQSKLTISELVIGDVKKTVLDFYDKYNPAPVACIFEDLDYYTSTLDSFNIFETEPDNYLPRIPIYFDDVIGRFEFPMNEWVGELAAIKAFNELNESKKIGKINYLNHKRRVPAKWNDCIYVFQDFEHPRYRDPIREKQPHKCALEKT